ncbi:MAG: hypothetical protein AAGI08_10535, partial [Bacteroidota bacterium]
MRILLSLLLAAGLSLPAAAQYRLLATDHEAYPLIQRLQRRGHLLSLHPTALPYTEGELRQALAGIDTNQLSDLERAWAEDLQVMMRPASRGLGAELEGNLVVSSTRRPDPFRPLPDSPTYVYPNGRGQLFFEAGSEDVGWAANAGVRHDTFYEYDPDGLDAARRAIMRNNHAYLGAGRLSGETRGFLYLGRLTSHWGASGQPALVLSDVPHAIDQLTLRIETERGGIGELALRSVFGELDSSELDGTFNGRGGDRTSGEDLTGDRFGSVRRYVAAHRLDWRPSPRFALTLTESVLFSSDNAGPSLKYLNPLTTATLAVDNAPKNDENNGLIGGQLWWQTGRTTLHGELVLDDFDFVSGNEPPSIALTGSLWRSFDQFDAGVEATLVSARSYRTPQPEGTYVYLLRGLGTLFGDFVQLAGRADWYV